MKDKVKDEFVEERLYQCAQKYIPGGVNSPVRSFQSVNQGPIYIKQGKGAYLTSEAGTQYLDFCCAWGSMFLGHGDLDLQEEVQEAVLQGLNFGFNHKDEVAFAESLCGAIPSMEKVRLVNSGTEALMTAIRLARGVTGRDLIVKFEGSYHGHSDALLVKGGGSGLLTQGLPSSLGIPGNMIKDVILLPWNDFDALESCLQKYGSDIAAIVFEVVPGNMGVVPSKEGFLKRVETLGHSYGVLTIADEVITGFRFHFGAAHERMNLSPDITCLGKIIGGGLPMAAVGGKKVVMDHLSPQGEVYQAGTLSGNPLAVRIGRRVLRTLSEKMSYSDLDEKVSWFYGQVNEFIESKNLPLVLNAHGGMFTLFFTDQASVQNYRDVQKCHVSEFQAFHHYCMDQGILLPPSQFESAFISMVHTKKNLEQFLATIKSYFEKGSIH